MLDPPLRSVCDDEDLTHLARLPQQRLHDALERGQLLADLRRNGTVLPLDHLEVARAQQRVVPIEDGDSLRALRPVELWDERARVLQLLDIPETDVVA